MKSLIETLQDVNEGLLKSRLTNDDKKNYKIIAAAIHNITGEISDWMEMSEENENSDTASLAHQLSNLASLLEGDWDEEVTFKKVF